MGIIVVSTTTNQWWFIANCCRALMEKEPREYKIIEPPIYEALDWEMDLIVSCLEVIRQKLPEKLNNFPAGSEYDLVSLENPHGPAYPVIGIRLKSDNEFEELPDFLDLYDLVEKWIMEIGIDKIKRESKEFETPTWEQLKTFGHYPVR